MIWVRLGLSLNVAIIMMGADVEIIALTPISTAQKSSVAMITILQTTSYQVERRAQTL
jgi:hypothetical protein